MLQSDHRSPHHEAIEKAFLKAATLHGIAETSKELGELIKEGKLTEGQRKIAETKKNDLDVLLKEFGEAREQKAMAYKREETAMTAMSTVRREADALLSAVRKERAAQKEPATK
jgi:hypothetical protein